MSFDFHYCMERGGEGDNQGRSYPKMKCTQICLKVWWRVTPPPPPPRRGGLTAGPPEALG